MVAAYKLRAVPINVNYRYVAEELAYLFHNAQLRALVLEAGSPRWWPRSGTGFPDSST